MPTIRVGIAALLLVIVPFGLSSVQAQGVADAFIRGYEEGLRLRQQRERMEQEAEIHKLRMQIMEQQRRLLEQQRVEQAATAEADSAMATFATRFPDWRQHEARMLQYAKTVSPDNLTTQGYLELLYRLAKADSEPAPLTLARPEPAPVLRFPTFAFGSALDPLSTNIYTWHRLPAGDTLLFGSSLSSGAMWNTTIKPTGSMTGIDSRMHSWSYDAKTGAYINFGTGLMCFGTGALRTCS